jgi:AcrR family transcriptional regulator
MESSKRSVTRAATVERIKNTARLQLAEAGASTLSLRGVARDMGQTSSALYRYFSNRDELLTALIIDAYNDLGVCTERAEQPVDRLDLIGRWRAASRAIRDWALAHPHEYALIFGTPIPGYEAPPFTIAAATRVTGVIARILNDDCLQKPRQTDPHDDDEAAMAVQMVAVQGLMPDVPASVALRGLFAWTQIFGFVSFELFGHLVGSIRHNDTAFELLIEETARQVGLEVAT